MEHNVQTLTLIINSTTNQVTTKLEEKAENLASQYDHQPTKVPDKEEFETAIKLKISSTDPNGLNSKITLKELEFGMSNLKSQAMRRDLIHNLMLKHLTEDNKSTYCTC